MKELNKKKIYYFMLIFLSIFAIGFVKRSLQNDTFYTIKIGDLILKQGIDMMDHFSFHTGLAYTYPHWLYDVIISLVYKVGGYRAIYLSSIGLFIILVYCVFKCSYKISESLISSFFATLICILAIANFITARAQVVSYIVFALEIMFIEMFIKTNKKRYAIGLIILSLLLCNMHVAVWPFFFILFLPYIVEGIIAKFKFKNRTLRKIKDKFEIERINLKPLFIVICLCLLTGLLTPIRLTPYTYLIKTMMGNSQKYIAEHQMITWKDSPFTIIMIIETLFLAIFNKIKLRDLFLVLGVSLMAIMSTRHISLLALIGSICFARTFSLFLKRFSFDVETKLLNLMTKKIVIIISFILVICFSIFMLKRQGKQPYINEFEYPVKATEFIKENIDYKNNRLFNDYGYGSYLLFNDIPVFIDSRADLYTKEFSGFDYDIFDDYMNTSNYEKMLDFYNIKYIITFGASGFNQNILSKNYNYKMLYTDNVFVIYERLEVTNE